MRRTHFALTAFALLVGMLSPTARAATEPTNRGLYISPVRAYTSLGAGETITRSFRVANLTDKPLKVSVSAEAFSVTDYAYDFRFNEAQNDWLTVVEPQFTLKPFESREAPYRIAIPRDAPSGGHYYSLFATSDLAESGLAGTVRATSLLYLTINGPLTRTSQIQSHSLFPIVVTPQIPYKLEVRNTGNIHYFAYFSATVDGLFYHDQPTGVSQLLMPGTVRAHEHTVASPLIPGIYKVTYGYTPDQGARVERSQFILFLPPWFMILLAILGILGAKTIATRKKRTAPARSRNHS